MKKKRIHDKSIKITEKAYKQLKKQSAIYHIPMKYLVEKAIDYYVQYGE